MQATTSTRNQASTAEADTDAGTDVVVVGAGPTGLLLAAELALAGVRVVVLERRSEPDTTIKAGSINVATAEILDRRGLRPAAQAASKRFMASVMDFMKVTRAASGSPAAQDVRAGSDPVGGGRPAGGGAGRPAGGVGGQGFPATGHFAGIFFRPDLLDQSDPRLLAHAGVAGSTLVPQAEVEAVLGEHAASLGVPVRRGVEVSGLTTLLDASGEEAGVRVDTSAGPVRAAWVVAADGGRSPIRHWADIAFPGTDAETTGYQAVADMSGTEDITPGWTHTPTGVYCFGPIPGRVLTVQFDGGPDRAVRDTPVTPEELQASIRLVTGREVTVNALHGAATRWSDNARQATTYRAGRVLLAGDAAHVHSPFSGQGLNLGVGDAVNLAWKLAATIHGWAPAGLLDTYTAERHPIGAAVLDSTRAQVALMRGDAKTTQLRAVARDLLETPAATTAMVLKISGVAQTYDLGAGAVDHPLVGRLIGDTPLADGTRLADHAHTGRFVLLDRTPGATITAAAAGWSARVAFVHETGAADQSASLYRDLTGLLVRPDGIIAWASSGEEGQDSGSGDLLVALDRWAGAPDSEPAAS